MPIVYEANKPESYFWIMIKKILLRILLALGVFILVLVVNLVIFNIAASKVSEGVLIENRDPDGVALLVIDIQGGTTGAESALKPLVEQSGMLLQSVNSVIEEIHKKEHPIIYIRTEVVNPLLNILNNTMARGTEGAELDPRLEIVPGEVVVKRRGDSFWGTDLDRILADRHISELVIVGLDAQQCVKSTVKAAMNRGYRVVVVEDAVISRDNALKDHALEEFREMGATIMPVKELQELN
jgi:nicotinamidase-related amidase